MQVTKNFISPVDCSTIVMAFKTNDASHASHLFGAWKSPKIVNNTVFVAIMLADETIELIIGDDIIIEGSSYTFLYGTFDDEKMSSRLFCIDSSKKVLKIPSSRFWLENQDGLKVSKNSNNGYAYLLHLVGNKFPLEGLSSVGSGSLVKLPETIFCVNEHSRSSVEKNAAIQATQAALVREPEPIPKPNVSTAAVFASTFPAQSLDGGKTATEVIKPPIEQIEQVIL